MLQQGMSRRPDAVLIVGPVARDLFIIAIEGVGGLANPQQHLVAAAVLNDVIAVDR